MPCAPLVTHVDGKAVSAANPARGGEMLIAYATGLGQTNPPSITGHPAAGPAPVSLVAIDFSYAPNALPRRPPGTVPDGSAPALVPAYAGAAPGFVGLYQIQFAIPRPPVSVVPPCVDTATLPPGTNEVQSNLMVSFGALFSFDGAGICVAPEG